MMQNIHIRRGSLSVAFVCMVLGFMLALQFRSTQDIRAALPQQQRMEELTLRLERMEEENERLHSQLNELASTSNDEKNKALTESLKMFSGQTAVTGPGVIIILDDSTKTVRKEDPNLYLVHDEDMLKVINELRSAGAEAISINGQRLTATSEIRCAGPTISVNNVRSAPPFEIKAIGSIKDLVAAVNMRGGVADTLKVWGIRLEIQEVPDLLIPAYTTTTQFKYAVATDKKEEGS